MLIQTHLVLLNVLIIATYITHLSVALTTGNVCICVSVCMYVHIIPVPIVHVYNDTSAFMEYWGQA